MTKLTSALSAYFFLTFNLFAQNFEVSKFVSSLDVKNQSFIYALPQTSILVALEVTKTIIKKGPYAEYAQKLLAISNAPLNDSKTWAITDVKISAQTEADPLQYYAITCKTLPENLSKLFTVSNNGIVLDFTNSVSIISKSTFNSNSYNAPVFDPNIMEETVKEKVDTFYKTVMTDSSFVRIPVFKKQIQAKTIEDIAKETAHELTKTRKRKLKMLRGEYEFHPDGAALKVMTDELAKQEAEYLAMFTGLKFQEKQSFTFVVIPQNENPLKELCYFSANTGISESKNQDSQAVTLTYQKEQEPAKGILPDKTKNMLFVRTPIMTKFTITCNNLQLATTRLAIYQFGPVQVIPLGIK